MARKAIVSKEMLLDTAFLMAKEEGIEFVTARKLAVKVGCSTQPIFRIYQNMEDLVADVFLKAIMFYEEYYRFAPRVNETPFVDLGMAYIRFAKEQSTLFSLLFLSENRFGKSLYDILNARLGFVSAEIKKATEDGVKDPSGMFMKMWIFIHGIACMCTTNDYDLDMEQTKALLNNSYQSFKIQSE
ncbi:MAG: TetR/AcrR family transcriptional regulator [Lachnospiraceae bacterium]